MEKSELAVRVKAAAYLEGDFVLRSGRRSKYYMDKYLFETQPDILAELGRLFAARAGDADVIAGAELGGVALAAAASMVSGKRFIIVRNSKKDYGTSKQVEGLKDQAGLPDAETLAGKRVLLVEDIATTGGQVLEAAKVLTEMGATVTRIVATIDRQEARGRTSKKPGTSSRPC